VANHTPPAGPSSPASRTKTVLVAILLITVDSPCAAMLICGSAAPAAERIHDHAGRRQAHRPGRRWGGTRSHYLDVEYYTSTGQALAQRDRVSERQYQRATPGDVMRVHYLPSDPAVHTLGATVQPDYFWLLMGLVLFLITAVYCLFGSARRSHR
jgi:hypothetical protein